MSYWDREVRIYGQVHGLSIAALESEKKVWLEGDFFLADSFCIKHFGEKYHPKATKIVVGLNNDPLTNSDKGNRVEVSVSAENCVREDQEEKSKIEVNLQIYISLSEEIRAFVLGNIKSNLRLQVVGHLEDELTAREIDLLESDYKTILLVEISDTWTVGSSPVPSRVTETLASQISQDFETLVLHRNSQVGRIYKDFVDCFVKENRLPTQNEYCLIRDLVSDLRAALRPFERDSDDESTYQSKWSLDSRDYLVKIVNLPNDMRSALIREFDTLWPFIDCVDILAHGEKSKSDVMKKYTPRVEELEAVAFKYRGLGSKIYSRTFEQILVNALLFCETIEFGRDVHARNKPGDFVAYAEIPAREKNEFPTQKVFQLAIAGIKKFAVEAIKVALTFGVAYVLAAGNYLIAWVITTGYTLYRWLRSAIVLASVQHQSKSLELLGEMASLQKSTIDFDFDPTFAHSRLLHVTNMGARFSAQVPRLIQKMIDRG